MQCYTEISEQILSKMLQHTESYKLCSEVLTSVLEVLFDIELLAEIPRHQTAFALSSVSFHSQERTSMQAVMCG